MSNRRRLTQGVTVTTGTVQLDERDIPHELRPWRPLRQDIPVHPDGSIAELQDGETFWANSHYLVHRREFRNEAGELGMVHLSMRTVENDTRHDWREMQRVKTELCGPDWEGVELYPTEARLVDGANQYHLWCFPYELPFGFSAGMRATREQAAQLGATQR